MPAVRVSSKGIQEETQMIISRQKRPVCFMSFPMSFSLGLKMNYSLFSFFKIYFIVIIIFFTLQYCIGFAIHQHSRLSSISTSQRFIKNETH